MSEWKEYKLGEVINLKRGYDLPNALRKTGSIPIISSSGITDYHNEAMKKAPGVITGRYGTIGQVFFSSEDYWPLNTTLYVQDFKGNYPKFIFYLLKNFDFAKYSDKSAVPGINRNDVHTEDVIIPNVKEQIQIASVLSSLDDKIDLLHRQNKTLEQLAETLFRQWFVEEEWSGSLSEYAKVQGGYAFKSKDFKANGFAGVIKIRNISMGIIDIRNSDFVEESVVKNLDQRFKIKSGDFLIAMTGAEIGKIGIVEKTEKEIWLNQRVGKLEARVPYGNIIGYLALKSREGQDHITNACAGSAQENISTTGIEEMSFASYDSAKANSFGVESQPLFEKIIFNHNQIRTLTQLRDTLLPKLMSGELRVS